MKRLLAAGLVAPLPLVALPAADAQVYVRAPLVRVQVGPGVGIRAPFFRFYLPDAYGPPPPYYIPAPLYVPAAPLPGDPVLPTLPVPNAVQPTPAQTPPAAAIPAPPADLAPPAPQTTAALTLEQFSKSFQAKAGAYEVELVNPLTRQPTRVRFTLPEGTPRRVRVARDEIEFIYGPRRFVRIEFDRDGAQVVSR
jgi:hypothetical protein